MATPIVSSPIIESRAASVSFENVSKIYSGDVRAVDDISLNINAGELVTLLGPSGCGKTTTLRMIAGLESVTSGRLLIGDQDVTRLPATDRDVSMVFQSYALFPHLTVLENVAYGLKVSGLPKHEIAEKANNGLEVVGLPGFGSRLPSELSGGQQQRVAVARALVLEPQVLLFDEPLSNLDAKLRRQVREEIRELQLDMGLTVVYVTHDQEEALAVSDRIVVMSNARIAQVGSPRQLYEEPVSPFVADFIGESNLFEVRIDSIDAESDLATVLLGSRQMELPSRGLSSGNARLAVRPHRVRLDGESDDHSLPGKVVKAVYVGKNMEYTIATDMGDWFVTSDDVRQSFQVDQAVGLTFDPLSAVLLPDS